MELNRVNNLVNRNDLTNFPFLHKVWLVANTNEAFLHWSKINNGIIINLDEIDNYLNGPKSIFKCKNRSTFVKQLIKCGFQAAEHKRAQELHNGNMYELYHTSPLTSTADILKVVHQNENIELTFENDNLEARESMVSGHHKRQDWCFKRFKYVSTIEQFRLNFSTRLHFGIHVLELQRKIDECDSSNDDKQNSVIELPIELFENPNDSVSCFKENPEYAGFYGDANSMQIKNFYEDFLPVYANSDSLDIKPFKVEVCSEEAEPLFTYSYSLQSNSNDGTDYTVSEVTNGFQNDISTKNSLEPIFDDEDISMDDYLKFNTGSEIKDTKQPEDIDCPNKNLEILTKSFPTAETETKENDNNFKKFFNQYRDSMNLLYQNH